MEIARFDGFMARWNENKSRGCRCVSNIFTDADDLARKFEEKACWMHFAGNNIYAFVPRHDFYDLLYVLGDEARLCEDVAKIFKLWAKPVKIRVSVIGKEPRAGESAQKFSQAGFKLAKKLLRMQSYGKENGEERLKKSATKTWKVMKMFADENRECMSMADPQDAPEILEILKESFDVIGDNVPEIEEIRERIAAGCVAVLRKDGKIVSLSYREIRGGINYGFYDVTRLEYRGGGGFGLAVTIFMAEQLAMRGVRCARSINWRDANDEKLVKYARSINELPEGVVLYNMYRDSQMAPNADAGPEK